MTPIKSLFRETWRRVWFDLPLRGKGIAVVGLPIVASVAGLILLGAMAKREQHAQEWIDHTTEVRGKLSAILTDLLGAESSARGYVIGGDRDYLPRIESAKTDAEQQIRKLEQLVKDNPIQLLQIPVLRQLVADKFGAITALTQGPQTVGNSAPNPQFEHSRRAMRPLHALLNGMDEEEGRLQRMRRQNLEKARTHSIAAGAATLALGLTGGLAGALLFSRSISRRMESLWINARALRLESALVPLAPARDEIGRVEQELEVTSALIAERSEKLRRGEARLRAIIDNTTAIVYVKDLAGHFKLVNRQMEEVFALPASHILGKTSHDLFRKEFADQLEANDREVLRLGQPREFEEQIMNRGELRIFLSSKVPLLDAEGKPYALCGVSTDITERYRAAEQLRAAHHQLEVRVDQRTAELQKSTERLQEESTQHQRTTETLASTRAQLLQAQKMEIIGSVASGIAHDFNNILTAIMGYAALLLKEQEPAAPETEYAGEIMRAAERAAALSKQLLGFGRVKPGEQKITALEEIIRASENMLRRVIGDTISLRTTIERDLGTVRVDPSQVEQLLLNLVVNARDAMPTGGRITIALRRRETEKSAPAGKEKAGPELELSVTDEGTGIPPEVQCHMFDPFFTTKRPGQGTGLGLATCAMIAEQNQGRLEFTTAPARGTTFSFILPALTELAPVRPAPGVEVLATGHETLLVVEDEPAVGEIMALLLRDLGYHVITAENGEAAERAIAECEREIDLVLTDLNMPRMNGRELLERVSRRNPGVRVIITSGNEELLDEATAESLAIDFLPKPFTRQHLAEKVRTALEKSA